METYGVYVDITVQKTFFVDAENEEQAKRIVDDMMLSDGFRHANSANHLVGYKVTDIVEE